MKTPWITSYPKNIPAEIGELEHANLKAFVLSLADRYGDLTAFSNFNTNRSFNYIITQATAFAAYLQNELGYQKGDRFAIMMPNLIQYPIVIYGCFLAGVEIVNVNPLYTSREVSYQLNDAGVKGIIIAENFAHTLAEVQGELPQLKDIIVTSFGDEHPWWKALVVNVFVRYIGKLVPNYQFTHSISYKTVIERGKQLVLKDVSVELDDVAILQYTGGTTGRAKGAMLTHRNLLSNVKQVELWVGAGVNSVSWICIAPLPMYHVFCCTVNALCFPGLGMQTVLVTNPRDMKSFIGILKKYKFNVMTGLNTLFKGLMMQPEFQNLDFSELKYVVSGGMPLEKKVSEQWQKITGNVLVEGYGLTETSPIICVNLLHNDAFTNGIGYPMPSTLVSMRDDNGNEVPEGEPGELWVKGPQVMKGYWNQSEETKSAITEDGWFKTGDIATMDNRGFVRIVDRKKDMILVSGFNVYPSEIEAVLSKHPSILEVAVIGVPCENTGEKVKAFVVSKKEAVLRESELRVFAAENLTNYKRPKEYEFIDELPKSNVGKVLRRELVKREKEKCS